MYSNYDFNQAIEGVAYAAMWTVVSLILAIIGGVLVYFLFQRKRFKLISWTNKIKRFT